MTTEQWYAPLVRLLADSQQRSETHLRNVAISHRTMAARRRDVARALQTAMTAMINAEEAMAREHDALADAADALAESIPSADQAAADLGAATDDHELITLRTVLRGEQQLNTQRDADVAEIRRLLVELQAAWREDRAEAARQRAQIIAAMGGQTQEARV